MCPSRKLSNKTLFPTFAKTFTQTDVVFPALKLFLQAHNWTDIGVIYSSDASRYVQSSTELFHALDGFVSYKAAVPTTKGYSTANFERIIPELRRKARSERFLLFSWFDISCVLEDRYLCKYCYNIS